MTEINQNVNGIFVSQVGLQPAAVAIAASALASDGKIGRILLLASQKTLAPAERLKDCLDRELPGCPSMILPMDADSSAEQLANFLRSEIASDPDLRFFLNISGGLSFFWAKVSSLLRGTDAVIPVFAERDKLCCPGRPGEWELRNLGLSSLLALHGLRGTWTESEDGGPVKDFTLFDLHSDEPILSFSRAFERYGHLHVLIEGVSDRIEARNLLSKLKRNAALRGLQPQVLVTTGEIFVFLRLKAAGIDVIRLGGRNSAPHAGEKRLARWLQGTPPQPGITIPLPADRWAKPDVHPLPGAGGDGAPLLVCLGNDPSTTLTAIFSQRPVKTYVLYDESTPLVSFLASRMALCAADLPVGDITFIPLRQGFRGEGISDRALQQWGVCADGLYANVTPGSKPQSWAFGQLSGVRLVSINAGAKPPRIEACDGKEAIRIPLTVVPSELSGRILGGGGAKPRLRHSQVAANLDVLTAMAEAVSHISDPEGNFPFFSGVRRTDRRSGTALHVEWQNGIYDVDLKRGGKTFRGAFSAPKDKGRIKADWLEDVTGGAFLAAGARDLCVGIEWPWDLEGNRDIHRTEIDVAFSWQNTHVVVSVKASPLPGEVLPEKKAEIKAMARECFGRFSLPVIVYYAPRGMANELRIMEAFRDPDGDGVLEIPASLLSRPNTLKSLLDQAMLHLRL